MLPGNIVVLIGMAIVGIVSANIFNSWTKDKTEKYGYTDPPRHYTTFMRFNLYRTLYILFMLAGYLILLACPDLIDILGIDISREMAQKIEDQSYVWAALIIIGIVPNFPVIQTWEAKLRDKLQDYAFIPFEAQRMISILEDDYNAFQPESVNIQVVIEAIGKEKNSESNFTDHRPNSLRHKWCKLSYLYTMIGKRKADREFTRYINCCDKLLYEKLEKEYSELKQDIDKRIEFVEDDVKNGATDPWREPIRTETDKILNTLLKKCYQLISCGILSTEKLPQNRTTAFTYFGLCPASFASATEINWNTVLKSSMVIFCSAFLPTLLYYYYFTYFSPASLPRIFPDNAFEALTWSLIGLAMFVPGLIGSTLVDRLFWRQQVKRGQNPLASDNTVVHSFLAGCIGYGIALAVLVLNKIFRTGPLTGISRSMFLFPLLPAVSSSLTTYFLESRETLYFKHINRRIVEVVTIGGLSALGGFLILLVLEKFDMPSMVYIAVTAGLIGASVGYTFIEEYRIHMRPEKERRKEARYAISEDAHLVLDDAIIGCQVVSITPSFATINTEVPRSKTSARLKLKSLGEIPVIVTRRNNRLTVLQLLLDTISKNKLNTYLQKTKEAQPGWVEDAAHVT